MSDLIQLWQNISAAGGVNAYVEQQLIEHGYLVERRETENMSKAELERYKKTLKKESAERKKLKKQAWQAYKASHIVHLGENIYWNDSDNFDKWDHPQAEKRAAENELPAVDSPQQLATQMNSSIKELRWLAYHRDAATQIHYHRFTIPKSNGCERSIWAPLPKLKAHQRWILHNIVEKLPMHGAAHGFLPGRSILTNAKVHSNSDLVVRIDLKDFFPTLTFPRVKGIFRQAGYREQIAILLAMLCTEAPRQIVHFEQQTLYIAMGPRCLPQGAPTSPALSNIASFKLDRRLSGLAKKLNWRYTRYADDLTFSLPVPHKGPDKLGQLLRMVSQIVKEEGFAVNTKKTWVGRSSSRQAVTGLIVNGSHNGPRIPRERRRKLRAILHNLSQGKPLHEGETFEQVLGEIAFLQMTQPEEGRELLERFLKLQGGKKG